MTERHGKILTYHEIKTALADWYSRNRFLITEERLIRFASFIYDNYGTNYYIEYPPSPPEKTTNP
ncbi:hypothetical protein BISA_1760 [Bifidobacterium saguini DSM 23967]|uniref:Uncharacterized protein n=2 Tax=Bifidobacterium saguini TaxID=762210 RepID=A0A087D6L3_9BIFI|nr:hypothetical protein [Bifidobacterium saguini]KFI91163.1 hypothetical protein BISA_1760 [Bifidobacterium saguini DSM 23967]QTB91130.1 hypothetical protein BSD967_01400 [Bifidobacterium saguini]